MKDLRNIVDTILVPHTAFQESQKRLEQCFEYADGAAEPICLALVGESRTGKSRALEELTLRHPGRRLEDGLLTPVWRVRTPSKPTVKGFVDLLLIASHDPKSSVGTEQQKTARLIKLARECGVKLLLVDEFQHFYDKVSHKVSHYAADWLKGFVDETRIALVVAGLPSCLSVLHQNEQLAGRFLAPIVMPRFDWEQESHRAELLGILGAFQEALSQHFELPSCNNGDMGFRFWCATGGLMGYLTKTLRQAIWNALDAETTVITLEDLALAHDQAVWAKNAPTDLPRPFARAFSVQPSSELIARIRQIGTKSVEDDSPKPRRSRKAKEINVSEVLAAH